MAEKNPGRENNGAKANTMDHRKIQMDVNDGTKGTLERVA